MWARPSTSTTRPGSTQSASGARLNIVLFREEEIARPLPKRDPRAVHLLKTLHKTIGDEFEAGVLGGLRGRGRIQAVGPADGALHVTLALTEAPPPRLPITLALGFPRPIQTRRILRDLSSMGLAEIDLVWTERGDSSYRKTTLLESGGAEAALVEGAVQSRDTTLPRVKVYESLESWLCDACGLRIAADNVRPQGCFSSLFEKPPTLSPVSLAVGSERGWSNAERASLENAGFTRLSLGTRALRTETACIAAAALAAQLFAPP